MTRFPRLPFTGLDDEAAAVDAAFDAAEPFGVWLMCDVPLCFVSATPGASDVSCYGDSAAWSCPAGGFVSSYVSNMGRFRDGDKGELSSDRVKGHIVRKLHADAYEIGFLEGWKDSSTTVLIGPERPGFTPNIQIHQEDLPPGMSRAEYVLEQRGELSALTGFTMHETGERTLGGQQADFHEYSWTAPQGKAIRQMQLATERGFRLYTVTCSALESDWASVEAAFLMSLSKFRFRALPD